MKDLRDTKEHWLLTIFDALDQIEATENMKAPQLIACIITMATDSIERIKEKILEYNADEFTDETQSRIAHGYVNMLNESKNTVLCNYSKDTSKMKYSLTARDIDQLAKYFFDIVREKFSNDILIKLFINNFMVCSFTAIINAIEHKQLVKAEKEKQK